MNGVKILFAAAPGYGLMLPLVPLVWAARAAGHEVLLATTGDMAEVGAHAGLPVVDVFPDRNVWNDLLAHISSPDRAELPPEYRQAAEAGNPFAMFTVTMTEGTIAAGREFGADLVVYTSDHSTGALAALALGVPGLEVGNRVSWSMRDRESQERNSNSANEQVVIGPLRERLDIPAGQPELIARIDPRAPSMGGITADEPDPRDGVSWWPMRYVPYNGGAVLPDWTLRRPARPRVGVTLGTVVPIMTGTTSLTVVIEALGGLDVEVVLAAGSADLSTLGELPGNVHSVGFLPLSGFLSTCSLLVHHGGSGTTAAPLHYGVPQLVLPSFADNPMSAQRVVDRGVGLSHDPATIDVATAGKLLDALLTDPRFALAAREVAAEMATQPSPASIIDRLTTG
ncbi:MAG TPA: nucleotide disphospho-sugar-binding domain-containing protein [Pseudonocardiaceae bacterium]|nr:nucleotide disphospho-sugar-binding domain-containing protein [Pseudonocardiaceae bacterium]